MPGDGAITFRDIVGKLEVLRITCDKCGRRGQYRVDRLMARYGLDGKINAFSNEVTADCPCKRAVEFPSPTVRAAPPHARSCTVDDVEFYYLKLIEHLCNVTRRPLTLWPSNCFGPRWAGREAWVTYGDGRTEEMPADAARGSRPLMTLLPRHYHARVVKHYAS